MPDSTAFELEPGIYEGADGKWRAGIRISLQRKELLSDWVSTREEAESELDRMLKCIGGDPTLKLKKVSGKVR